MSETVFFQMDKEFVYIADGEFVRDNDDITVLTCYIMQPNETLHIINEEMWDKKENKIGHVNTTAVRIKIPFGNESSDFIKDKECKVSLKLFDDQLSSEDLSYSNTDIILKIKTDGSYALEPGKNLKFQICIPKAAAVEGYSDIKIAFEIPTDDGNYEEDIKRQRTFNLEKKPAPASILSFAPEMPFYLEGDTVKLKYKTHKMDYGFIEPDHIKVTKSEDTVIVNCTESTVYTFYAYEKNVQQKDTKIVSKCIVSFRAPSIRKFSLVEGQNEDSKKSTVEWDTLSAKSVTLNGENVPSSSISSVDDCDDIFYQLCATGNGWTITNTLLDINKVENCSFKSLNIEEKKNAKYDITRISWTGVTVNEPIKLIICDQNMKQIAENIYTEDSFYEFIEEGLNIKVQYKDTSTSQWVSGIKAWPVRI